MLILGGSVFLGRAFAAEALRRGHEVTTFNRGRSGSDVAGVQVIRGDREDPADRRKLIAAGPWDAVVDTSGFQPRVVGAAARALSGSAGTYLFVSSVHAYAGWPAGRVDENSPRQACAADAGPDDVPGNALKAGCERAVEKYFVGDVLILNVGMLVGPHDSVGRLPWWLERVARGGRVLAPGGPDRTLQLIDARDIATFGLDQFETHTTGRFVLTSPPGGSTFGEFLALCAEMTGSDADVVWADDTFLLDHGVAVWTGLPLWAVDQPAMAGAWLASTAKAVSAGLRCRPLGETVRDTWEWLQARGPTVEPWKQGQAVLGIDVAKEQRLLTAWLERPGS